MGKGKQSKVLKSFYKKILSGKTELQTDKHFNVHKLMENNITVCVPTPNLEAKVVEYCAIMEPKLIVLKFINIH